MYKVENRNALGRVVNGQASFKRLESATGYMWDVIRSCRGNRACQIKSVYVYAGDNVIARASV